MCGQVLYIMMKVSTMTIGGGFFQLLFLWALNYCSSIMHFCWTGFTALIFVMEDGHLLKNYCIKMGIVFGWHYWLMLFYMLISTYYLFRAFKMMFAV